MSDSPCGFTLDQFLAILKRCGPELSAHEVAALGSVSIRQVLCCYHHHCWEIQAIAGESGWLYRQRQVLDPGRPAMVRSLPFSARESA